MKISAMPSLCDSTDFGLSDPQANKKFAASLTRKKCYPLHFRKNLFRCGSDEDGCIFLFNPESKQIEYYIKYKKLVKNLTGQSVTQTALWRDLASEEATDLTNEIVFAYLIPKYGAIMSDKIQTDAGQQFWIRLMTRALKSGFKVKLADYGSQELQIIESNAELRLWLTDDRAWSYKSIRHQAIRFIIEASK